jgi:hypothetical protein
VPGWLLVFAVLGAACSPTVDASDPAPRPTAEAVAEAPAPAPDAPSSADHPSEREYPDRIVRELRRRANEPRPVERSALPPRHLDAEQFPVSLVDRERIVSGGPPPDGIAAIDEPTFARADRVDWLADEEAVLVLRLDDRVRVYPVQIMIWHEIVNDTIAGIPVAVTYCPLCNSAVAFDRRVDGRLLDFGTSGAVYQSALVMYDRQTESLWTHFDGRSVLGTLVGAQLRRVPVATTSWAQLRDAHPDAQVLSRDTGHQRPYGENPYRAYDQLDAPLRGFFSGDIDARQTAMRRVVGIAGDDGSVAVTLDHVAEVGVVDTRLDGRPVTVWHRPGLASALQAADVAGGDDIGATGVFVAAHDGRTLTFARDGERFVDAQTRSTWNILGEATAGPLAGARLDPLPHVDSFWFAWSTYQPGTDLIDGG